MAEVSLRGVRKSYGTTEVIHGLSCDIADGELLLNARLSNETRERDHLLNCAVAQHTINFIPEVIAAAKTALVNPYPDIQPLQALRRSRERMGFTDPDW